MVIVFRDPGSADRLVAHRAVKRWPGETSSWQTQGDANRDPDPWPVAADDVRGRVRWGVPGLGSVVSKLSGWPGAVALVGFPLGLLAVSECSDYMRRRQARSSLTANGQRLHLAPTQLAAANLHSEGGPTPSS